MPHDQELSPETGVRLNVAAAKQSAIISCQAVFNLYWAAQAARLSAARQTGLPEDKQLMREKMIGISASLLEADMDLKLKEAKDNITQYFLAKGV